MKKKTRYIRNDIVFDPNIPYDPFEATDIPTSEMRKLYRKGRNKRKVYRGI